MLIGGPQLDAPLAYLPYYADLAESYEWTTELGQADTIGGPANRWVEREPVGVVAAITPWNYPNQINLAKIVPALAAGCTVVLKPAPDTPWTGLALGHLIAEHTDIPAGVVNVITSSDKTIGEILTTSPDVDLVSFTGSTATGRRIMAAGADTIKKVFLELGGKSAAHRARRCRGHAVGRRQRRLRLLHPRRPGLRHQHAPARPPLPVRRGRRRRRHPHGHAPLRRPSGRREHDRPHRQRRPAGQDRRHGAAGRRRRRPGGAGWRRRHPVRRGLLVPAHPAGRRHNAMAIARDEIFGPVLVVIPYDDDDDAVRIANDSIFGLSGGVASADRDRAHAVARRIRTGTMSINNGVWYAADVPFGGYKQSGIGREMGVAGFEEYLEQKAMAEPAA